MLRMKHPDHGFHHAYNKLEEETMRANGWVDDVPEPVAEPVTEPDAATDVTRDDMLAYAEERGLKVDRRWSTARLAEELAKAG